MDRTSQSIVRELDRRTSDGVEVRLLWHPHTDRVSIAVEDSRGAGSFELEVQGAGARDAFHHPYAYAGPSHVNHALVA